MRSSLSSCLWISILAVVMAADSGAAPPSSDSGAAATAEASDTSGASATDASKSNANPTVTGRAPVYAPPKRGRPRARVGGGVRGNGPKLPTLRALVPDHVAHTARDQPTLLWYVSDVPPAEASLMFSLTSEDEIDPLIRAEIAPPTAAGLQRIELASYEFSLETGKEYEWSVALVPDQDSHARDLVTLGWIERVDAVALGWIERVDGPEDLSAASPDAAALAAAGLWYDAVDVADREEREALLDQIGLVSTETR
jgi:hypothetical protein